MIFVQRSSRAVAQRRQIGNQSDEPEQHRNGGVSRDREHVPHQRAAELRPDAHGVGIGKQPVGEPGAAHVDQRENAGAGHGEQRHGLGKTVDRVAPRLPQQQQDGGNQRAGVADTDPPDEVDDGESPTDGNVDAPDADAFDEQVGDGEQQHHGQQERDAEADEPAVRSGTSQHDRADLVGDRAKGVARLDDRCALVFEWLVHDSICSHTASCCSPSSSGFGLRMSARYVVRGRVFRSRQQTVIPRLRLQFRDPAVGIVDVAEDDRVRRARLLAGRLQFAVAESCGLRVRHRSGAG